MSVTKTKAICSAVTDSGATDTEAVGEICQAGTNSGSCKPEINELISKCSVDLGVSV